MNAVEGLVNLKGQQTPIIQSLSPQCSNPCHLYLHFFSENHLRCGKHGMVLDQDRECIVQEHVKIQKEPSKYNGLSNMINESNQSTSYQTNERGVALQSSNLQRYKTGKTREVCKYYDCVKNLNEWTLVSVNQGIHIAKQEKSNTEFVIGFVPKHKLKQKQNNNGKKLYKCSECFYVL